MIFKLKFLMKYKRTDCKIIYVKKSFPSFFFFLNNKDQPFILISQNTKQLVIATNALSCERTCNEDKFVMRVLYQTKT